MLQRGNWAVERSYKNREKNFSDNEKMNVFKTLT